MIKNYDLEERTFRFARNVRIFVKQLPKTIANIEDIKQLVRSSGSVGANFIEAVEAFSQKDAIYRIKICRKEAKESKFWLTLLDISSDEILLKELNLLTREAYELMNIFGSIIRKNEY